MDILIDQFIAWAGALKTVRIAIGQKREGYVAHRAAWPRLRFRAQ